MHTSNAQETLKMHLFLSMHPSLIRLACTPVLCITIPPALVFNRFSRDFEQMTYSKSTLFKTKRLSYERLLALFLTQRTQTALNKAAKGCKKLHNPPQGTTQQLMLAYNPDNTQQQLFLNSCTVCECLEHFCSYDADFQYVIDRHVQIITLVIQMPLTWCSQQDLKDYTA